MDMTTVVNAIRGLVGTPYVLKDYVLAPPGWVRVDPKQPSTMAPLVVSTLGAVIGYVKSWYAQEKATTDSTVLIHVVGPDEVRVLEAVEREPAAQFRRNVLMMAKAIPYHHRVGQPCHATDFLIWLQTGFVQSDECKSVQELIGSIRDNEVTDTVDDGLAQQVTTSRGVKLVGRATIPNPVVLAPYRTFPEVLQPEGLFALRATKAQSADRPTLALYEADGGAWRLPAVENIMSYLREALGPNQAIIG